MTNDELLQMYINKVDQEQAEQRQDMTALRQELRDFAAQTDQRLDRMEQNFRNEFKEHKRFIVGTVIAAVGAAAAVVGLIMQFV